MSKLIQPKLGRPAEVLLVEDSEGDAILTREGFLEAELAVNLHHVVDGEACMDFLHKRAGHEAAPTPDLVLLDLNMPRMDGREVLAAIADDPGLKHLPVVVLSTSSSERDVRHMHALRCSSYIVKPVDFGEFQTVVRELGKYWFTTVELPTAAPS